MDFSDFAAYLPDRFDWLVVFPLSFLYALAVAQAAAWLKSRCRWKTNYSRKLFHVAVFTAAFVTGLLAPFAATAVGGIATGMLFDGFYQAGYLVAGLGDAAGEPVGVRFGRHRYRVPTLTSVKCFRSLEGSAAVLLVSFAAAALALHGLHYTTVEVLAGAAGAALCAALTEALSPHGWDNLTTQVAACLGAFAAVAAIARAL